MACNDILSNFPPKLRKNIEELCLNGKIGLSSITLNDISIVPHRVVIADALAHNFHFIFKVPYGGKRLAWDMLFNPEDFLFAPDFHFNDDLFMADLDLDVILKNIPSLVHWNMDDSKAVTTVLNEFHRLYKKKQLTKLQKENVYSRYCNEYKFLINVMKFLPENVEVVVEKTSVKFLISIDVDCTNLPDYIQPSNGRDCLILNPGHDFVHLLVTFLKLDGSKITTSLQLSPRLDQVLDVFKPLSIPVYKKDSTLSDYVLAVSKMMEDKIKLVVEHCQLKKEYILYLAAVCASTLVEYDTEHFSKCSFLYKLDDYQCLVVVRVGAKFPKEKPEVTLHSLYCQENSKCNEVLDQYTFITYLSVDKMINYLIERLPVAVAKFKLHTH